MSGTAPKTVPEINLDEFERRLRAAGAPSTGVEDPLAELTRLVNAVHSDARRAARPGRADSQDDRVLPMDEMDVAPLPAFAAPLRSSLPQAAPDAEHDDHAEFDETSQAPALTAPIDAAREPRQRTSGWTFKVVGLSVLGFALLVGAIAIKNGRVPGLAKTPPFIAADEAPTKVQPPNAATVQSSGDIAALLMKDSATPTPVKVVNNEEQPVDLRTQTQPADLAPTSANVGGSPIANAPDTPVVAPAANSASVAPLFPAAKPVKTVSVRPDGTLIGPDAAPVAPASPNLAPLNPTPAPPPKSTARALDAATPSPDAATPKLDIPTKLAPPKTAARVVAKTDTTAPADATDTTPSPPMQLGGPRPSKPVAAPPQTVAEAAPTDVSAPMVSAASADAAPASAGGDGLWGVQLAAPHSAADAKSAIGRLKSKYGDALGDSELGVHEADVKGQTIYRVRVTGLSKGDAGALCAKLKAGGGDCFVAKD